MLSHYSERDHVLLYQVTDPSSYENLSSLITLAEYISNVKSTSVILIPAAFQRLAPGVDLSRNLRYAGSAIADLFKPHNIPS